jgi:GGDEF domain-containing protein
MRASDIVARLGGEEFVAMIPGSCADAETLRIACAARSKKRVARSRVARSQRQSAL